MKNVGYAICKVQGEIKDPNIAKEALQLKLLLNVNLCIIFERYFCKSRMTLHECDDWVYFFRLKPYSPYEKPTFR